MPDPRVQHTAAASATPAAGLGRTRRQAFERRQRRRSGAVAALSTTALLVATAVIVPRLPGWERVRFSFFNGAQFRESLPIIWGQIGLNIRIFLVAEVVILAASLVVAVIRNSRSPVLFPLRVLTTAYVHLTRGVPIIIVLYLFAFGVPALRIEELPSSPTFWATVALVVGYTPYVSEVFKAGIDSVHESQRMAARSLGLSSGLTMRFVVLPQAVRRVIPPLLNDFAALQKDSALVAFVGPIEAFRQTQIISSRTFNYTPYLAAALIFVAFTVPLALFTDRLIRRQQERTSLTRGA